MVCVCPALCVAERACEREGGKEAGMVGSMGLRATTPRAAGVRRGVGGTPRSRNGALVVVAATTPQFKSTKHHRKSRPIKHRQSDRNKPPAVYEPLPPPPPQFTVVSAKSETKDSEDA